MSMIAYLTGRVIRSGIGWNVVLVSGIGYKVFPVGCILSIGDDVELEVVDFLREDRRELYVFTDTSVLELFERLIEVSGIGPKLAQKMLSGGSVDKLKAAILKGDIAFLTTIPGVGKKTAQKIILELKGVLVQTEEDSVEDMDTLEALISLGYARKDVLEVVRGLTGRDAEDRLREALRALGR